MQAHDSGAIHFHDMDYIIQPMFNCCLINLEDMLQNGTVINGKKIDTPKSFQVACTVTTQIIAQVASGQYGGQSINGVDRILAPFVRKSYEKYLAAVIEEQKEIYGIEPDMEKAEEIAWKRTRKEVKDGIQTIQYQINTLMTTNGQAPFVTLFMYFQPDYEYAKEAAMIDEEILEQRLQGIKNEQDVYVTPAFPKLIYVLDEHNVHPGSPYYYLTELAAKCTAKRMYPDYISAKKCGRSTKAMYSAPWAAAPSSPRGRIKKASTSGTAASIWASSPSTCPRSASSPGAMRRNSLRSSTNVSSSATGRCSCGMTS